LLVAHGISRLLIGSTFDGGEELGKFVAGSQGNILEISPSGSFGIAEIATDLGEHEGTRPEGLDPPCGKSPLGGYPPHLVNYL
jgi:hypothetical protein